MARTLIGALENAEHLRLERVPDRAEQACQRRIVGPLAGPAAGSPHPAEIGEVLFHGSDQLPVWSGHRAFLRVGRTAVYGVIRQLRKIPRRTALRRSCRIVET